MLNLEKGEHGMITSLSAWNVASELLERAVENTKLGGNFEQAQAQASVATSLAAYAAHLDHAGDADTVADALSKTVENGFDGLPMYEGMLAVATFKQ